MYYFFAFTLFFSLHFTSSFDKTPVKSIHIAKDSIPAAESQESLTVSDLLWLGGLKFDSSNWALYDSVAETRGLFDFAKNSPAENSGPFALDKLELYYFKDTLRQVKVYSNGFNNIDYHLIYRDSIRIISFDYFGNDISHQPSSKSLGRATIINFETKNRFWFLGTYFGLLSTEPVFTSFMELSSTLMPVKQIYFERDTWPSKPMFTSHFVYNDEGWLVEEKINSFTSDTIAFNLGTKTDMIQAFFNRAEGNNSCTPWRICKDELYLPLWRWDGNQKYTCTEDYLKYLKR